MSDTLTFRNKVGRLLNLPACPYRDKLGLSPLYATVHQVVIDSQHGKNPTEAIVYTKKNGKIVRKTIDGDVQRVNAFLASMGIGQVNIYDGDHEKCEFLVRFTPKEPLKLATKRPPMRWTVHN